MGELSIFGARFWRKGVKRGLVSDKLDYDLKTCFVKSAGIAPAGFGVRLGCRV